MKVTFEQLKAAFNRVLISRGVDSETADACAEMFARTTESGVYSHGVNRFPRFIQQLENGDIIPDAQPKRITSLGAIEQWDAQRSIGNLTAKKMMDRAIELAADHGIGLVALRNANHWMRGGSYGWQAAEKGYIGICWTNSIAVMPPWGAKECRIGTNPLIVAIPSTPITMVDMSMSMFSYGMLEVNRLAGRQLPVDGGFDDVIGGGRGFQPYAVPSALFGDFRFFQRQFFDGGSDDSVSPKICFGKGRRQFVNLLLVAGQFRQNRNQIPFVFHGNPGGFA